jgi:hypothetical protein
MNIEEFRLPDKDKNFGRIFRPDHVDRPTGACIICHGGPGGRQIDSEKHVEWCIDPAWVIVTFDNFACGHTGGSDTEMTFDRWGSNCADVLRYVQALPYIDEKRVGFIGISSGSEAALRCAISYATPAFIVSIATCCSPNYGNWPAKILCDNLHQLIHGETCECCGHSFTIDFYLDAVGAAPVYRIREIQSPVFFLQGESDNAKRIGDARMGYEYMKSSGGVCKHHLVPGGNHGLNNVVEERNRQIRSWLKEIHLL